MNIAKSDSLFSRAKQVMPGGVNSPVRAFKAVGGHPIFMKSARGAYMFDEDGNKYLDYINSWGPMILGHAFEEIEEAVKEAVKDSLSFGTPGYREVEIAELMIDMIPGIEKVRMVNSGTEATMSAIRVARGVTGRDKIIKFEGCYHGHGDSFLIAAGSGAATFGVPDSPGVTDAVAKNTLTAEYNNLQAVQQLVDANDNEIAAIILEPVAGNMGCVLPSEGFLEGLRHTCTKNGILLIFDEVMTGFRLSKGGAQELFGIQADLVTYGKIIGGGMPVGAYAGKSEIMDYVSPAGPVYQAGTLSGNPIAMSAGLVMLNYLNSKPGIYDDLEAQSFKIIEGIKANLKKLALEYTCTQIGSMQSLFFTHKEVRNFGDAKTSNLELFSLYYNKMLQKGIYLPPSQYETLFISSAIDDEMAEYTIASNYEVLKEIQENH